MIAESTHWYDSSGQPRYEADLRKARKELLYPSVTTITGVLDKPELIYWKQKKVAEACWAEAITNQDSLSLPAEEFAKQMISKSDEERSDSADLGTHVHAFLENWIQNGKEIDLREDVKEATLMMQSFVKELSIPNTLKSEIPFCLTDKGFAGKIDCVFRSKEHGLVLLDFKTQNVKNGKPAIYPTWGYQLAAYNEFVKADTIFSGIISTNPEYPESFLHKWEWDRFKPTASIPSLNESRSIFYHCYELFRLMKKLEHLPTNMEASSGINQSTRVCEVSA